RRAARDHDGRIGMLALELADGLARLPHRLRRHRAGIDDDGVGESGRLRLATDHFRLIGVEPAAEGDDVDPHLAPLISTTPALRRPGAGEPAWCWGPAPFYPQPPAGRPPRRRAAEDPRPGGRARRRAGGRAASLGEACAALPGAQDEVIAGSHARERNVRAL